MQAPIILDISRLLSRAARRVPTGIDRVEHAYADGLLRTARDRLRFAAVSPFGRFSHLPTSPTRHFVQRTGEEWQTAMPVGDGTGGDKPGLQTLARKLQRSLMVPRFQPRFLSRRTGATDRPTYLLVSHHHLHQPGAIQAAKQRLGASFVCFIHDLIPIEFPEYNRPKEAAKHLRRIETATRFADGFVVNSASTRDALLPFLHKAGRTVPLLVAPLGVHAHAAQHPAPAADRPYFLYIGTIEPRKNHLLLFNLWRRLAIEMGSQTPRLVLVGQRGWENEMVLDVLERSEILREHIVEHNALPDAQVQALVAGARAVLLPSFAEGYGLPVAEALATGTPVICSDLPALREVGGEAAEFLDPLDGLGWLAAIREYAAAGSVRRERQVQRIAQWAPPSWDKHLDAVLGLIDGLTDCAS